ncbi:SHOCT domain-containing protein [Mycobacterium intracellulare]|jgi:putative membrane protein|uniref:SHOCT domain-containing protein n=1 Tax=Mycobacterium intracellulare TaxID=1767 RepID=UPI001158FA1B|nr:SHOCT domain-containing protein [Mycobacterium intracellulare]
MCGWGGNGWMWNGGYGGWGWVGWILTAVVFVVVFALLITVAVMAVRYLSGGQRGAGGPMRPRGAEDVLAERFARGDIDEEEFRQRVTALREHR